MHSARKKSERIRQTLALLSNPERKELIVAYRDYAVEMNNVDPSVFGSQFEDGLEASILDGDKDGVLSSGAKDVVSSFHSLMRHHEGKRLSNFFEDKLSERVMRILRKYVEQ